LEWKLGQSKRVKQVFNVSSEESFNNIFNLIKNREIGLTVVGPEGVLDKGIVDYLNSRGYFNVFGPTSMATKIETDKFLANDIMDSLDIPHAKSVKCFSIDDIKRELSNANEEGIVVKARGSAKGKGVGVFDSEAHALNELEGILKHDETYVNHALISERLFGKEYSLFGISDGFNVLPFGVAFRDYKRLLNGNEGPNTGGMGAYGPVDVPSGFVDYVTNDIMVPVVDFMKDDGVPFKGFLYVGMMGDKVLEFNARKGDPECQPAMMLLDTDLYELLSLAAKGSIKGRNLNFKKGGACCVVLATKEYPFNYHEGGFPIFGLDEVEDVENIEIFHGATSYEPDPITFGLPTLKYRCVTSEGAGRVLGVTAYSEKGVSAATDLAYDAASKLDILGGFHYREDIGS
jgi:phosphoribosylamine---glycine ligase